MSLSLTYLDWLVFSFVMIGSMAFGLYIAWPIVGASLFATNIGAEHLVGLSGDSYRYGLSDPLN